VYSQGNVTGKIFGTATDERTKKELAIRTFFNAQARRELTNGTSFLSDRIHQHISQTFVNGLYDFRQSLFRTGIPGDCA